MYFSSHIKVVRSRKNRWPGRVISPGLMGMTVSACRSLVGNLKTRNHLGNLVVDGKMILKLVGFEVDIICLLATWFTLIYCSTFLLLRP